MAASGAWHVPEAVLRFTVEADPNRPQVPGVDLSGKKRGELAWTGAYYRIDGKLYKRAIVMTCPGQAAYGCKPEYRRFVALIGVRQEADEATSIVFEVRAGTRKLYSSPPLTRYSTPIGIDVRIPPKTKQLQLLTTGRGSEQHQWAAWVNPGYPARDDNPRVGCVTLPVPGFDPAGYEVAVFSANGEPIATTRLAALEAGKVDQLFFAGRGWATYYAYWVPRDKCRPEPRGWQPNAGVVLETRRVDKARQRECGDLAGLVKVWNEAGEPVGRSFVAGVHHGYPVQPRLMEADDRTARNSLALYHYTGFFEAGQAGEYVFATASNDGSYLLVDDKPVTSWPGNHDYRGGIRAQHQGKVTLLPGIHKLDYFNCSPWGTVFTLAAWQPPGSKLGVMTGRDFPSVQGYVVTGVERNPAATAPGGAGSPPAPNPVCFDWDVVDDWRLDRDRVGLIRMRFRIVPGRDEKAGAGTALPVPGSGQETAKQAPSYRWTFDDGVVRTGPAAERVFLNPGRRTVTVQKLQAGRVLAETRQAVYAGGLADKIWVEPRQPEAFPEELARIDFRQAPLADVTRLYALGRDVPEPAWKEQAVPILLERADELMAQREYQPLCLELGQHLCSAAVQQYDRALDLYTRLLEKTRAGTPLRQQAMVLAGEVSLRCLGRPEAALQLLNQARWEKAPDQAWTIRLGQARAETLLAVGDTKELEAQMLQLQELEDQHDPRRQEVRRAGLLAQAARLAQVKEDPVQLDYALDNIETVLREEPRQVLSPGLNLVRLDVHLARGEYRIARYLAGRLARLDLTPYGRAEVLVRQVQALCALGDVNVAKQVLDEITLAYPNSGQAARAKAMVVEAATRPRPGRTGPSPTP